MEGARLLTIIISTLIAASSPTVIESYSPLYSGDGWELDVLCEAYNVVDGDTFDCFPIGRVRLADINTPELNTTEGVKSKQALKDLINQYGPKVYIDVDDIYVKDAYNRLVAVAYLRLNDTHVLNVNKWLLENGYAELLDYRNEFNPSGWVLYSYYPLRLEGLTPATITVKEITTVTSIVTTTKTVHETLTATTTFTETRTFTHYQIETTTKVVTTAITERVEDERVFTYVGIAALATAVLVLAVTRIKR